MVFANEERDEAKGGVVSERASHEEPLRIGVLYESDEWSDRKLAAELERAFAEASSGTPVAVRRIDMEQPNCVEEALACDVLVSRVFASAAFRGHKASLAHMEELLAALPGSETMLLNPARAHAYEVSKLASAEALAAVGAQVPRTYQHGLPERIDPAALPYPCIIKPDCGGRTTDTAIVRNAEEATGFLATLPAMSFLAQEYLVPERGFITRVEIAGGEVVLAVKRSIAENGLSAYRFGSTYELYPDLPPFLREDAERAAAALEFAFGSFDIIETDRGAFFIDANSVSNVSEDCTELFGLDLLRLYADKIVALVLAARKKEDTCSR